MSDNSSENMWRTVQISAHLNDDQDNPQLYVLRGCIKGNRLHLQLMGESLWAQFEGTDFLSVLRPSKQKTDLTIDMVRQALLGESISSAVEDEKEGGQQDHEKEEEVMFKYKVVDGEEEEDSKNAGETVQLQVKSKMLAANGLHIFVPRISVTLNRVPESEIAARAQAIMLQCSAQERKLRALIHASQEENRKLSNLLEKNNLEMEQLVKSKADLLDELVDAVLPIVQSKQRFVENELSRVKKEARRQALQHASSDEEEEEEEEESSDSLSRKRKRRGDISSSDDDDGGDDLAKKSSNKRQKLSQPPKQRATSAFVAPSSSSSSSSSSGVSSTAAPLTASSKSLGDVPSKSIGRTIRRRRAR